MQSRSNPGPLSGDNDQNTKIEKHKNTTKIEMAEAKKGNMDHEKKIVERIKKWTNDVNLLPDNLPCDISASTTRRDMFYAIIKTMEPSTIEMKSFHERFIQCVRNDQMEMKPVVVFQGSEDNLQFGILIYWDQKKSYLNMDIHWKEWNEENIAWFNMQIHARRMQIDFLPVEYMRVIKEIELNDDNVLDGAFVYLRKFTPTYKMKTSSKLSDEERFNRLLKGTPEDEYPNDELDDLIVSRVIEKYPKAKKRTKLLLFHTDLLNIRMYRDFDMDQQYMKIYKKWNKDEAMKICLECYFRQGFFKRWNPKIHHLDTDIVIPTEGEYLDIIEKTQYYESVSNMNI